jgi:hypothetical protein
MGNALSFPETAAVEAWIWVEANPPVATSVKAKARRRVFMDSLVDQNGNVVVPVLYETGQT